MSLKASFATGSGWMVLGASADYIVQFIVFAVLARLLSVDALGIVAFALVLTDIGRIFVNGGLAELTVQRKTWDDRFASVAFTLTMSAAAIFALLLAVVGGTLVERYYHPGSGAPTAALSFVFLIEAGRSIHGAKLRREFRYRQLAARAAFGTIIAGGIAVVLAFHGWGVWALVFQRLGGQTVSTLLTWRAARWRPRILIDRAIIRELAPFSLRVTASRALDVANTRLADVLVGVLLGPAAVAVYRVGARSLEAITRIVVQPFQDAALSAFSRLGDDEAIGRAMTRVAHTLALLIFPTMLGACVVARDLTVLLFGHKYVASGPVMSLLAAAGLSSTILLVTSSAYLAAGHAHAMLRSNGTTVLLNLAFGTIGAHYAGVDGVAAGVLATQVLMIPVNLMLMRRYLAVAPARLLGGFAPPFAAAVAMALLLVPLHLALLSRLGLAPRLAVVVAAGAVLYPALLLIGGRRYVVRLIEEIGPLLPGRLRKRLPVSRRQAAAEAGSVQADLAG